MRDQLPIGRPAPITVVTGLGRCGSSLMMLMLHRAGMPVVAEHHGSFEDMRAARLPDHPEWLAECVGKAVKVLDPHRCLMPRHHAYRFIWLERDLREQARSQVKLLRAVGVRVDSQAWRPMRRGLRHDMVAAQRVLDTRYDAPRLTVRFEDLLADPRGQALRLIGFCGLPVDAVETMAACVRPRSPRCLDGMLELDLLRGG